MSSKLLKNIEKKFNPVNTEQKIERTRLIEVIDVASDALSRIQTVIPMNPTTSSEFATYSNLYDEFRTMAIRITLISKQQYSVTNINGLVGIVYDNDDIAVLTTIQLAVENPTVRMIPAIFQHTSMSKENENLCPVFAWARPTAGKNTAIIWTDVGLPSAEPGGIKMFAEALSVSIPYFRIAIERFVEFRGRR
jgi:hypothetical protein